MPHKISERPFYKRLLTDIAGFGLIIVAPFIGMLPGPGGVPLFFAGLGLIANNHTWAKNILNMLEKKRELITTQILLNNPAISRGIDVLCTILILSASYVAATTESFIVRGIFLGFISFSLIILFSNQKRIERIIARYRQYKKRQK